MCSCVEQKNYSLKDNVQCMKKLMVGVGCPDLKDVENDDVGGLQSLFDVEQAKNIATYVHEGFVAPCYCCCYYCVNLILFQVLSERYISLLNFNNLSKCESIDILAF